MVFHAGTIKAQDHWQTSGGRVLCATALGGTISLAQQKAYEAIKGIHFEGMQFRSDIGWRAKKGI